MTQPGTIVTHLLPLLVIVLAWCAPAQCQEPRVPQWAKDAVWYQIFPERFRNGDPTNDPTAADLELPKGTAWKLSDWTGDWYKLQDWERKGNGFYDVVFDRRYGGDLQGVLDELDYLAGLGVTALYFNPLFEAYSLHKYDASTYHHIDDNFGPRSADDRERLAHETNDPSTWVWSSADSLFLRLLRECHDRGIRVILDGVFNHSGTRFWAFQDIIRNQQASPYADWYDVRSWDDPSTPENEFGYKGWWDYKGLPEFKEDANGFVPAVRQYFFDITKRWMDPNGDGDPSDGIDGWRLDVANDVSHVFWKEWRTLVKSINPDAYIVGEIWDDASVWLQGDQFDAVMNYRFARAVVRFFIDTNSRRYSATEFDSELTDIRDSYPPDVNYILQNLIDSHDTDRLPSMIINPNRKYDDANSPRNNPAYDVRKPNERERAIQKLIALFQMTYVGAPMVYYGTEAGMWGADDPDCRKPMVWPDLQFENERSHPLPGKRRPDDSVAFDSDMAGYYRDLIAVRKNRLALRQGTFKTMMADDERGIFMYRRAAGEDTVVVVINNSDKWASTRVDDRDLWRVLFPSAPPAENSAGAGVWRIPPKAGIIFGRK